jgi:hypothetical protein
LLARILGGSGYELRRGDKLVATGHLTWEEALADECDLCRQEVPVERAVDLD